jgi:HlyD family secretion protein
MSWGLLAAGCGVEGAPFAVGTLERDRIELAADSSEPITRIPVTEGDVVEAGALLVVQDPTRIADRLAAARARRDEAAARHEQALSGPRVQDIRRAQARLAGTRAAASTALAVLKREQTLESDGFASHNELDVLQGRYDEAQAAQQEAQAALDELREGTRTEVIAQARDSLAAAEAVMRELEVDVDRTRVIAPRAGTVEALPLEQGERPRVGQAVAVLRAHGRTYARVYVPEPLRNRIGTGSAADVSLDGIERSWPARVRWIATEAAFTPYYALTQHDRSRLAYLVEVDLTSEEAAELPVGVPVEVRFPGIAP